MMKTHNEMLARYNGWANVRLYRMTAGLLDEQYRRTTGAYFGSLHRTLNHLLVADRIWMYRLSGAGDHPGKLDAILFDDLSSPRSARQVEDARLMSFVEGLDEADFGKR